MTQAATYPAALPWRRLRNRSSLFLLGSVPRSDEAQIVEAIGRTAATRAAPAAAGAHLRSHCSCSSLPTSARTLTDRLGQSSAGGRSALWPSVMLERTG